MASMRRRLNISTLLLLATVAAALGACASPAARECGATGIFCPSGTHCAAAQGICLPDSNTCGDAHVDPGEACDDGNTNDGDGCSHDCLSTEVCGNHIKDEAKGEICDDGNTDDGDGCSHDCLSDETCGNKIIDSAVGELCDDGNDIIGDGCSHNCRSLEVCGNGIVDPGEACDKIPLDLTKCSADCKSTLQCGNGEVDPGEECDVLGQDADGNECRSDCVVNRCGDGFVNETVRVGESGPVEECDDAPKALAHMPFVTPTETSTCNVDCTKPRCGDGKVNREFKPDTIHGEQCDNGGDNANAAACTANCQINVCGDHLIGPGEQCDDGDRIDTNACTNECKTAVCGDGILGPGEQCDDHNTASDDGCSDHCVIERCGDGVPNNHEVCDTGTASQACNADCTTPSCGDGIVNAAFTPQGAPGPEQCDPPSAAGCSDKCQFQHCGNGVVDSAVGEQCDDGPLNGTTGHCSASCHRVECGNGILDVAAGEQCDDGNNSDHDACVSNSTAPASCKIATCGDGHVETVNNVEECDEGTALNGQPGHCSATCHTVTCGNGFLEVGEDCDDGNRSDADDCLSSGLTPATQCKRAACGDGVRDVLREACDNGPNNGTAGNLCSSTCTTTCGNGILDPGEQCDDGATGAVNNNQPGSHCNALCQLNVCGDGDPLSGTEQCDLGLANSDTGACTLGCKTARCGDGLIRAGVEQCDDPSHATSCDYTASPPATCQVCDPSTCQRIDGTAHFCGDGIRDTPFEACDDGNATCGSCSPNCGVVTLAAAKGFIFAAAGKDLVVQNVMTPNDTFQLSDGFTSRTFEFSTGTVTGTNIKIAFDPVADDNGDMAQKIADAINSATGLQVAATRVLGIVILEDVRFSSLGNGTTLTPRLSETVATPNFAVIDMAGGAGGNCLGGTACASDDDCASGDCNSTTHLCL